ncbi:MAG: tetratricopeptide repeat protein [Chloroflexota bacterium]|nr:tetratricopeptide repeat protein [Chloroflexota bacterium]
MVEEWNPRQSQDANLEEKSKQETARTRKPASLAAAILREDFESRSAPPGPEPLSIAPQDEFDNDYLCPYCAAPTYPDDHKCPACSAELWIKTRRKAERSSWLWVALALQMASTGWPAIAFLSILAYAANEAGVENPLTLVPVYLGLPSNIPPEVADAVLELVPHRYILPFVFYLPLSLILLAGLYLRWRPIFYLLLSSALLTLVLAGAGMIFVQGLDLTCGAGGVILALLMCLLLFQLEDDFFFDKKRILLRVDRGVSTGLGFLVSGRRYAQRKMWAMAVIHLRRAVSWLPGRIDCHLELATAYIQLKRYDLAAESLSAARRINPNDPWVRELTTFLDSLRPANNLP